ncbi:MAG: hypothetical protein QM776_07145 [Rhodocyclaceae bacterium]
MSKIKFTGLAAACLMVFGSNANAAEWSDTSISYRYGRHFREPANSNNIKKHIYGLTHVSGNKLGSNFFNVDMLQSDKKDPAKGGGGGAQEVYVVYINQMQLGKIMNKKLGFGPVSDFAWSTEFDFNSKNDDFAAKVRKFITGPTIKFGGSFGWADLSLLYYKEKNNNGIMGVSVDFDSTYRIGTAWGLSFLSDTPVPLKFNGFLNYTGSKGKDGFGNKTGPETLMETFLMVDVGKAAGVKDTFLVGPGYQYWRNKFGNVPGTGTKATTAMLKAEVHF